MKLSATGVAVMLRNEGLPYEDLQMRTYDELLLDHLLGLSPMVASAFFWSEPSASQRRMMIEAHYEKMKAAKETFNKSMDKDVDNPKINIELYLIKFLFSYSEFSKYGQFIETKFLKDNSPDIHRLFTCVSNWHKKYPEKNIVDIHEFVVYFYTLFPAEKMKSKMNQTNAASIPVPCNIKLNHDFGPPIEIAYDGDKVVTWLTMDDVDGSKTAKQSAADYIIGIGKSHQEGLENIRHISLSKNKLRGDEDTMPEKRHGKMDVRINAAICRFEDI